MKSSAFLSLLLRSRLLHFLRCCSHREGDGEGERRAGACGQGFGLHPADLDASGAGDQAPNMPEGAANAPEGAAPGAGEPHAEHAGRCRR